MIKKTPPTKKVFKLELAGRPTKSHVMCFVLAKFGPMDRKSLMFRVAVLEGKPFRPNSHGDYFMPGRRGEYVGDGWVSPRCAGAIVKVKRTRKGNIYDVSDKGRAMASLYENWGS